MRSATSELFLVLLLGFACRTSSSGLDVIERSKSSRPEWVSKTPFEVKKERDGSLSFVAFSAGVTILEKGVSGALEKGTDYLGNYIGKRYFGGSNFESDELKYSAVIKKVLNHRAKTKLYSVCDVYYEKRKHISLDGNEETKFDIYLCLRVVDHETVIGQIKDEYQKVAPKN